MLIAWAEQRRSSVSYGSDDAVVRTTWLALLYDNQQTEEDTRSNRGSLLNKDGSGGGPRPHLPRGKDKDYEDDYYDYMGRRMGSKVYVGICCLRFLCVASFTVKMNK